MLPEQQEEQMDRDIEIATSTNENVQEPELAPCDPVEQAKAYANERKNKRPGRVVGVENDIDDRALRDSLRKWLEYKRRNGHK